MQDTTSFYLYFRRRRLNMNYFETMLLNYLRGGKVKMEITGFDMDDFQAAVRDESKRRLELIGQIVFEDNDMRSDTQKIKAIKLYSQKDFYS